MKCSACGKKLATGISKCPRCGQSVDVSETGPMEALPTATMQVSDGASSLQNPEVAQTFSAPPRVPPTDAVLATAHLAESALPRPTASSDTTFTSDSRTLPPAANRPAADETNRGQATFVQRDSQVVKDVWRDLAHESATPLVTLKGEHGRAEILDNMVIQRRSLKPAEQPGSEIADYQLLRFVGEGGMGTVYAANQSAVHRTVAIKTLKPEFARRHADRAKFLNEAKITGDLAHPNIVPIHDLGISDDGTVFYSMKLVGGQSWDDVMRTKSPQENLEVLHRVCDAIAFAHSRHVIHRDLKPENIMLGEFGEVLVMDWGLAVNLARSNDFVLGGTPAYMAPEMAVHDVERIGYASDIYLLSAILYEIVAGFPPHPGSTVTECVAAAARNTIIPFETDDELLQIALRGMATDPGSRFPNVAAFQRAIAEYQSHLESITAAERGYEELEAAESATGYERFSRSVFSFQESLELWPENRRARQGLQEARLAYAQRALKQEDFDLGLSLVSGATEAEAPLYRELKSRSAERATRQRRLRIARWVAAGFGGIALLAIGAAALIQKESIAEYLEYSKTQNLLSQAQDNLLEKQRDLEKKNSEIADADRARQAAEDKMREVEQKERESAAQLAQIEQQKQQLVEASERQQARVTELDQSIADKEQELSQKQSEIKELSAKNLGLNEELVQKNEALEQQIGIATARKNAAQLGQYQSDILLSKAMIEEGQVSRALNRLQATFANDQIPPRIKGWELHRLYQMCHQSGPRWVPDAGTVIQLLHDPSSGAVVAISSAGQVFRSRDLTAPNLGFERLESIEIVGPVFHAALSPNGRWMAVGLRQAQSANLLIWDLTTGQAAAAITAHLTDVRFVHFPDNEHLYTIGNHTKFFQAARWQWDGQRLEQQGAFFGFEPVEVVAISPSQQRLAVGCDVQQIYLYDVDQWNASAGVNFGEPLKGSEPFEFRSLCFDPSDPDESSVVCGLSSGEVIRVRTANPGKFESLYQHREAVTALQPITQPTPAFYSASEDETIKRFDLNAARVFSTITGQLGKIRAALLMADAGVLIAADDSPLVRTWQLSGVQDERTIGVEDDHSPMAAAVLADPTNATPFAWIECDEQNALRLRSAPELAAHAEWQMPGHGAAGRFQAQVDRAGRRVATAAADGQLFCYDVATGRLIGRQPIHPSAVFALSPHGELLVAVDPTDETILRFGAPDAPAWKHSVAVGLPIDGLVISGDSQFVAVRSRAGAKSKIQFIDLTTGQLVGDSLERIDFHSWTADATDGFLVASSFETGAVSERRLFRYRRGQRDAQMNQAFEYDLADVLVDGDTERFLTTRFAGDQQRSLVAVWGEEIWQAGGSPARQLSVPGRLSSLRFDPLDSSVLLTLPDGTAHRWNPAQGDTLEPLAVTAAVEQDWFRHRKPFDGRDERLIENSLSRNSALVGRIVPLATGYLVAGQGNACLLDRELQTIFRILPAPAPRKIEAVASDAAVVSLVDGRVWIVPLAPATPLQFAANGGWQVPGHYHDCAVAPDRRLWLVGEDGQIWRCDLSNQALEPLELAARDGAKPTSIAVSSAVMAPAAESRTLVAIGFADGSVQLFETNLGTPLRKLTAPRGVIQRIQQLRFSGDGRFLCGVGVDGSVVLWNTTSGAPVVLADAARDVPVTQIAFNQASSRLALGRADGTISLLLTSEDITLSATADSRLGGGVPELFSLAAIDSTTPRPVMVVAFTSDDRELLTAVQGDNRLVQWLSAGWELEKPYRPDEDEVTSSEPRALR